VKNENAFLPYARQLIEEDDIAAVGDVLRSDWLTTGPIVDAFELALAEVVGSRGAAACSSGTAALHLAGAAVGLGPGHSAVVPSLTFVATANAVRLLGAEVVFADVDPESGLMEAEHLAKALATAEGTSVFAAYPVHLNGQCSDMAAIADVATSADIKIVEDASHALGTCYGADDPGTARVGECRHSDLAAFSFHPVKAIAMGEGGALTAADPDLLARSRRLRSHGLLREASSFERRDLAFDPGGAVNPWYYEMPEVGYNYRASDIHCALGLSQLSKLGRFVRERAALVARYDALLPELAPLVRPVARSRHCQPAWHLYVALIDFATADVGRGELMTRLGERGIGSQVHYLPVHLQPYYQNRYGKQRLPGAERYYAKALSLPLHVGMALGDVDRVVDALSDSLAS
jgi:UDP-4-amino-4,6-dideoxy-N-acetyl-beta-L-altrosamine transaminase